MFSGIVECALAHEFPGGRFAVLTQPVRKEINLQHLQSRKHLEFFKKIVLLSIRSEGFLRSCRPHLTQK